MQEKKLDLRYKPEALKFLKRCDFILYKRIMKKIDVILKRPFSCESKKLKGIYNNALRVRIGNYRIIYDVDFDENKLIIIKIDKRGNIYRVRDEELCYEKKKMGSKDE